MQSSLLFAFDPDLLTAYLCDHVQGRYRLLARAQVAGWAQSGRDLPDAALAATAELERTTGRALLSRGRPAVPEANDGSGVDMVVAVALPQGQLRVAIVGAERELSYDSAPRLVEGAGHLPCHLLNLDRRELRTKDVLFDAVRLLWASEPDVVLVATSAGGKAEEELGSFAAALGAVASVPGPALPTVVFSGSEAEETAFRQSLGVGMIVERVAALRPSPEEERLEEGRAVLANLHAARWFSTIPGYKRFASWLVTPIVPRDLALGRAFRFLAAANNGLVFGADLDRRGVAVTLAAPNLYASHRPQPAAAWDRLASKTSVGQDSQRAERSLGNLILRPGAAPTTPVETLFHCAWLSGLCRELLDDPRGRLPETPPAGTISHVVGTCRGQGSSLDNADAASLLLDALQPTGVGYLVWDAEGLLAPAGALASVQPRLGAELLLGDAAQRIAAFVAPSGAQRAGSTVIEVEVTFADRAAFKVESLGGSIETLPVVRGERAVLDIRGANPLDVGGGWGKKARVELDDTPLGVILDTRGRPVPWPEPEPARRGVEAVWRRALGKEDLTGAAE